MVTRHRLKKPGQLGLKALRLKQQLQILPQQRERRERNMEAERKEGGEERRKNVVYKRSKLGNSSFISDCITDP